MGRREGAKQTDTDIQICMTQSAGFYAVLT